MECHTNRIESAWKDCKDHFRRINGTNIKMFEQHLMEIVWRNHIYNKNKYSELIYLVKRTYQLNEDTNLFTAPHCSGRGPHKTKRVAGFDHSRNGQ